MGWLGWTEFLCIACLSGQPELSPFSISEVIYYKWSHASTGENTDQFPGRSIAFTDDDCTPAPDWLKQLADCFEQAPDRMIGGKTINALTQNPYSSASQLIVDIVYAHYNVDPNDARFFATNNMALPQDKFNRIGGFEPDFFSAASEDRNLCDRWRQDGFQMTYAPQVIMNHAHPLTLRSYWRQHFTYGRGAVRFHQARTGVALGKCAMK